MTRDNAGKFAKRASKWGVISIGVVAVYFVWGHPLLMEKLTREMHYEAEAMVIEKIVTVERDTTIEQMKNDLIEIVWGEESGKHVPDNGEVMLTFDPNSKMYQSCIKIGGRHPKDCISYGPMQIKIGTIQHYAPQVYGHDVTEKEARDIAENLEAAQHFFLECSIKVQGCVWNWTGATKHRGEIELLIKYIRAE